MTSEEVLHRGSPTCPLLPPLCPLGAPLVPSWGDHFPVWAQTGMWRHSCWAPRHTTHLKQTMWREIHLRNMNFTGFKVYIGTCRWQWFWAVTSFHRWHQGKKYVFKWGRTTTKNGDKYMDTWCADTDKWDRPIVQNIQRRGLLDQNCGHNTSFKPLCHLGLCTCTYT